MSPLYDSLHSVPPREKECLWLSYVHLLLANLMLFCQSIDLVITIDTFYWLLLSKFLISQSEALLYKSRSALLECARYLIVFHFVGSGIVVCCFLRRCCHKSFLNCSYRSIIFGATLPFVVHQSVPTSCQLGVEELIWSINNRRSFS